MIEASKAMVSAALWIALWWSGAVHGDSGLLPVWDIETPVFNALGGSYNAYGSDGCEVVVQRTPRVHRGPAGHSLKIGYHNLNAASCGIWIHLFREGALPKSADWPDMSLFPYLSFWIEEGGKPNDLEVRMADSVWLARDDSKVAGRASQYLGQESGDGWREVVVPFRDFKLPSSKAAVVALQFPPQTSGVLYVDDICFKSASDVQAGYSRTSVPYAGLRRPRGMWLWETTGLLKDSSRERDAFMTLREAHVTDLFLQIPYGKAESGGTQVELKSELRQFIKTAHINLIRVHALDGYPEFSLRYQHETVLSLVRSIVAFNLESASDERFDGIHLDNEPYQLLGFDGPSRDGILHEYLELNEKVAKLLHNDAAGLVFGVDIPFWWDATGGEHSCCGVQFNGVSESAAHHIIDLADTVGIMAYRNFAGGLDGIVNHAQGDVDYAAARGKQAFVAVETFRAPPPQSVTFVASIEESRWQALPPQSSLLRLSRLQGYPLRSFTDGMHRYIGLAEQAAPAQLTTFANAIGILHSSLPGRSSDWNTDLRGLQGSAERYGRTSGEWRTVSVCALDKSNVPGGFGLSMIEEMPAKISLADRTREFVDEILEEVSDDFGQNPGFTGDAIHSLESYQKLRRK